MSIGGVVLVAFLVIAPLVLACLAGRLARRPRDRHDHDYVVLAPGWADTFTRYRCRICGKLLEDR